MNESKYTGATLEKALASNSLDTPKHSLTGMVKSSKKQNHVAFTLSGCGSWVDLPIGMIESAEQIGNKSCGDHSHPLMRITLKQPNTEEGNLLYDLLNQLPSYLEGNNSYFPSDDLSLNALAGVPFGDIFTDGIGFGGLRARQPTCWGGSQPCGNGQTCGYYCCRGRDGRVTCWATEPPIIKKFTLG